MSPTPQPHVTAAAHTLLTARHSGHLAMLPALLADAQEASTVNELVASALGWQTAGVAARHWKSGGPNRHTDLAHAALDPQGVWPSPATARTWPLHHGGAEAEIALRLACDVDAHLAADLTQANAHRLVDAMCVAIEVVSSRLADPASATPWDRMADAQSHGALVLGPWVPCTDLDWAQQAGELQINQRPAHPFVGTHSLNNPLFVLPAWLQHATRSGRVVSAGTVVTTGNWSGHSPVQRGDRVCARFQGIGEAVVQL